MVDRNEHLRRRREAIPSPSGSGRPMTRAELAEAVNRYLWRTTGTRACLDAATLARYERGQIRWPGRAYRDGLRGVLDAGSDAELGFRPTRRGRTAHVDPLADPDDMSTDVTGRPVDFLAEIAGGRTPTRVSWAEVDFVRETTRVIATSENRFGGGLAAELAMTHLRTATELLDATATIDVHRAISLAVGNLAGVVGFSAYDMAHRRTARQCYRLALWCADEGASASLRATVLTDTARAASEAGRHDDALAMIAAAQVLTGDLTATARAMLAAWRARLLAATRRFTEARDEIARADEWFAGRDPALDPAWLCFYDDAEHQGSIGKTRLPLACSGHDVDDTVSRRTHAIDRHGDEYVRSRTFSRLRLATLFLAHGDVDAAAQSAGAALQDAPALHSARLAAELRRTAHAAAAVPSAQANDLHRELLAAPVAA